MDPETQKDLGLILLGAIIGIPFSLIAQILYVAFDYVHSPAHKKLQEVVTATRRLEEQIGQHKYVGSTRSKYRFSMGILIDGMLNPHNSLSDIDTFQRWHFMADISGDPWDVYRREVQPIGDMLVSYKILGSLPWIEEFRQLSTLIRFVRQFEASVSELDRCIVEAKSQGQQEVMTYLQQRFEGNTGVPLANRPNDPQGSLTDLEAEVKELYKLWRWWLEACHIYPSTKWPESVHSTP